MQDLIFRRASLDEAQAIVTLVNACYRGDSSRRGWTSEADLLDGARTDIDEIKELIAQPESMILLCLRGEHIVGSVHLTLEDGACYVGMLVVAPEFQRAGLGKRVLEAAEDAAQQSWGVKRMSMTVISVRKELIAYYERRGYRRTGVEKPFQEDVRHGVPRIDELTFVLLEKNLSESDA